MQETTATENYYTLNHLALFTGLTDRTLRSYIAQGILQGEKIGGMWHFTEEQINAFVAHPAVRPSILAKKNALVYDFLLDTKKSATQCCIILDLPDADKNDITEFFCSTISNGDFHDLRFSFDGVGTMSRIILKGHTGEIFALIQKYFDRA